MTSALDEFRSRYADAIRRHLATPSEATLSVGHELGRRALAEGISLLDITEQHFVITAEPDTESVDDTERRDAALQFLLQTFTALDVATRGFLEGTKRYAQQRARADDFAARDAFRQALVDSLQDGFFVTDGSGCIAEVNTAFGEITGYSSDDLPYPWPHPWIPRGELDSGGDLPDYLRGGGGRFSLPVRHRSGHEVWLAIATNSAQALDGDGDIFVGTIRDITKERAAAGREQAAARLATALGAATTVAEVFDAGLAAGLEGIQANSAVAAVWSDTEAVPTVYCHPPVADLGWSDLDERVSGILEQARLRHASTVDPVPSFPDPDAALGVAAHLGSGIDGAFWLEYGDHRQATIADSAVATALAGQLGLALQRANSYDKIRLTSLTLQRAMLGVTELPPRFAVRYEPAEPPLEIGGDWYDVVPLSDDRIGVIVGDCVGRGLAAAAVMGQLRSSARALLSTGAGPGRMLDQLDVVAANIPGAGCTTVFAAVLDPGRGVLRYSSAGHLPGLLAEPSGGVEWLHDEAKAVPLATFECAPRPEATKQLAPGATLAVFTDGLVERRNVSIDVGIDKVARVMSDADRHTPDDVAELVLSALRPAAGYDDDVAMVVFRQLPPPLHLEATPDVAQLATIRRRLRSWLAEAGLDGELATDTVMAANEACTNSIEHGITAPTGLVRLVAAATATELTLTVSDTGAWKPPQTGSEQRGRGITMMRAVVDSLSIEHDAEGTVVRMRTDLTRQAAATPAHTP